MYISKVVIRNFRTFDKDGIVVHFKKGVNALISENNTGKTAIVDALRIAFSTLPYKKDIYFNFSDFHIGLDGSRANEAQFDIYFNELPPELFEIWDPEDTTKGEFHIKYYTILTPQQTEKIRYDIWGGPVEGNSITVETFDAIQLAFLGALRDAETEMRPARTSKLASLFKSIANTADAQNEIVDELRKANESILAKDAVKKVSQVVNENLSTIEQDVLKQHISLGLVEPRFDSIASSLRTWLKPRWFFLSSNDPNLATLKSAYTQEEWQSCSKEDSAGVFVDVGALNALDKTLSESVKNILHTMSANSFELYQNGLGYNNILFMSTVLGDMKTGTDDLLFNLLLVEEPEAHLHPQLQELVYSFLENNAKRDNFQVIFTSHSPTLVSRVGIDRIVLLYEQNHRVDCLSLSQSNLEDNDREKLERYLDVTKSQMLFAKGILFVEGISEALLMPVFAEYLGRPLDKYAVEVVNVDGLSFGPFANLLCYASDTSKQTIRATIITDDDRCSNRLDIDHYISKEIDYDTGELSTVVEKLQCDIPSDRFQLLKTMCDSAHISIYGAQKTLEYELVKHASNIPYLIDAITKAQPVLGPTLSDYVSSLSSIEEKAACIWLCIRERSKFKGEYAQNLAQQLKLEIQSSQAETPAKHFIIPEYIQKAIYSVTEEGKVYGVDSGTE